MKLALRIALVYAVLALAVVAVAPLRAAVADPPDSPMARGHFFTQASTEAGEGFAITDEGDIPLWDGFKHLGGIDGLGYPISQRFVLDGRVSQATQRAILQWNPDAKQVVLVDVLDRLHRVGLDDYLSACCGVPPALPPSFDAGKSSEKLAADRQAMLDTAPSLAAFYAQAENPLARYGLPTSPVTDQGDHLAVRTQRTVLQGWKTDVPWARAGEVTSANAGELARLGGLIPAAALVPTGLQAADASISAEAKDLAIDITDAAAAVRPAVVKVIAPPTSSGSGFLIDGGLAVTANHVVDGAGEVGVLLPDGRRLKATVLGREPLYDIAVLKVAGSGLPFATFGSSAALSVGDGVVALGYGALTDADLDVHAGRLSALGSSRPPGDAARNTFLFSDVGLIPGFSGGPLVNARGEVVGINTTVVAPVRGVVSGGQSLSVAADVVAPIVTALASGAGALAGAHGVTAADLTPELSAAYSLGVERGALITRVAPRSAAEVAGLRAGEIVTSAGGRPVYGADDLATALATTGGTSTLEIEVLGRNGMWRTAEVKPTTLR